MNSDPHPLPRADRDIATRLARYFRSMVKSNATASHFQDREILGEAIAFLDRIGGNPCHPDFGCSASVATSVEPSNAMTPEK